MTVLDNGRVFCLNDLVQTKMNMGCMCKREDFVITQFLRIRFTLIEISCQPYTIADCQMCHVSGVFTSTGVAVLRQWVGALAV
jgi:hypothetical protein